MQEAAPAERIRLTRADITTLDVDAIVNAANSGLRGGGGVDGAIHRAAGPRLLAACRTLGGCPTGSAVITDGYELPARHVIHAVGPVWSGGDAGEDDLLASAYRTSLEIARERRLSTVAFPAISCGVYRFPLARAAGIATREVAAFLAASPDPRSVWLCCFDDAVHRAYVAALAGLTGPGGAEGT